MRLILGTIILIGSALCAFSAVAGEIVQEPICFVVQNKAPYSVYGTISTDYYTRDDGAKARHRSNFRFGAMGTVDDEGYPDDIAEFCSYGPFYEGRKLEIVLRTLVPIFSCKSRIDQGRLIIEGRRKEEGGTETWISCYE